VPTEPQPYFALTPEERLRQTEATHDQYRRVFHPIQPEFNHFQQPWLVQDFIPLGGLVILAAPPKQGKTCLATTLALAVATGTPFAGMPCDQGGVLWLAQEESFWDRHRLVSSSPLADPAVPLFTTHERLPIDQESTIDLLAFWANEADVKLIVVDPLHGATSGRSLNDGWAARKTLDLLRAFCNQFGVTALVLHHAKRRTWRHHRLEVAENDQLAATASMNIVMTTRTLSGSPTPAPGGGGQGEVPESAEGENSGPNPQTPDSSPQPLASRIITLHCEGRGPFANRRLELLSSGPLDYALQSELPQTQPIDRSRITSVDRILQLLEEHGPLPSGTIIATLDLPDNSTRVALTRLLRTGQITVSHTDEHGRHYKSTTPDPSLETPAPNPVLTQNQC